MNRRRITLAVLATLTVGLSVSADSFEGWQAMRVIEQEGRPTRGRVADLDGDGREELILVNSRHSRLDIYRYLSPDQREAPPTADPDRPNELPTAIDFEREEVVLDRIPADVMVHDVDGDGRADLLVLEAQPRRLTLYQRGDDDKYEEQTYWDLLPAKYSGVDRLLHVSPIASDQPTVMISCDTGFQLVELKKDARATWLSPRERSGRRNWWIADLDRDGDHDLLEWTRRDGNTIRWYENTGQALLPAQGLSDDQADFVEVLADDPAQVLVLGGTVDGVLRRQTLSAGDESPLGRREPLPLPESEKAVTWTGIEIDGKPAVIVVDPDQPRLLVYYKVAGGWSAAESYPSVSNIESIAAPAGQPGTLLLRVKDATGLHISQWQDGRMSYPRPLELDTASDEEAKVIAMQRTADTTWMVRTVGTDLQLLTWQPGSNDPVIHTHKANAGAAESAVWLGGTRVVVLDQYKRDPRYLVIDNEGQAHSTTPAHLKKTSLDAFTVIDQGGQLKPALYVDGVLQWLDDDLQPTDQVMLPDELKISRYVPIEGGAAWAIEPGGERVHRLAPDQAGVMRPTTSHDLPGGVTLTNDPVVGTVLVDRSQLIKLSPGTPIELKTSETLDSRTGRPSGVREATFHRMLTTDIDGDGSEEVILTDDRRHQLTVLQLNEDKMESIISWPVFEDKAYPYGGEFGNDLDNEPRRVIGADLDGDGKQDLVLLSQDRVVIYLGREN